MDNKNNLHKTHLRINAHHCWIYGLDMWIWIVSYAVYAIFLGVKQALFVKNLGKYLPSQ